jgi:hypothetical protein
MTQTCSFAVHIKLVIFMEIFLACHQYFLIFFLPVCMLFSCLELNILLRLKDDLVLVFCIV